IRYFFSSVFLFFFFFQAEDGIRDFHVTGVQTCALPISPPDLTVTAGSAPASVCAGAAVLVTWTVTNAGGGDTAITSWVDNVYARSEERRVGKEWRTWGEADG